MSHPGDGDRNAFTVGATEATRLAKEIQDLGFDAARTVVDRFVDLFGQYASAAYDRKRNDTCDPVVRPSVHFRADTGGFDRLQSDMQRAADSYLAVLSQLNEVSLRFFDSTDPRRGAEPDDQGLELPDVEPGGRSSARLWLHNTTTSTAVDLRPWIPALSSHSGASLPPAVVTFTPERIKRLDPGMSREVLVLISVGEDAVPAPYHGQILIERLPDAVFPVTVRVRPPSGGK